jgi:hypothetical protein
MAENQAIDRYRRWYRKLLRFYSKPHRERFAESMEQKFHDLCRERAGVGKGLGGFVLWMFVETLTGIMRENGRSIAMQHKVFRIALVTGCILIVPMLGNLFVEGWNWGVFDFVFAGALLFGTGLAFEFVARQGGTRAYRVAVGIACVTGFALVFINAAVGVIGDGPVNLLYLGVPLVGIVGAAIARFQSRGMALALFATAAAQMLVPAIALVIWKAGWPELLVDSGSPHPPFHPGIAPVFGLNGVFAALWIGSALLFRHAGNPGPGIRGEVRGWSAS